MLLLDAPAHDGHGDPDRYAVSVLHPVELITLAYPCGIGHQPQPYCNTISCMIPVNVNIRFPMTPCSVFQNLTAKV